MAQQTLTGNAKTLGAVASGGTVSCSPSEYPQVVGGVLISQTPVTAVISPSTGDFSLSVTKGSKVKIVCKDGNSKTFLNTVLQISNDDTLDISTYLLSASAQAILANFVTSVNGQTGIVTLTPNNRSVVNTNIDYTASHGELVICDCTASDITITLPAEVTGESFSVSKFDNTSNKIIITGVGDIAFQNTTIEFLFDGTSWRKV